jgi:tripartite motif-containing protein 71
MTIGLYKVTSSLYYHRHYYNILFLLFVSLFLTSFQPLPSLVYEFSFGHFNNPRGISIDPLGTIYIADTGRNLLIKFDSKGDSTGDVGGYGWGNFQFDQPYDVCATNGVEIYVADYNNNRIDRFDRTLANVATLYTRDSEDDSKRFGYPSGVAVSRLGDLFICDEENIRIVKVNTFSTVERTFGGYGEGSGSLTMPCQVAIGPNDEVFVSDKGSSQHGGRIVVYDNFGNYVTSIGNGVLHNPTGIGIGGDRIGVCDSDTLYFFNVNNGNLIAKFSDKDILGAQIDHFNDISFYGDNVYILTDKNVTVAKSNF